MPLSTEVEQSLFRDVYALPVRKTGTDNELLRNHTYLALEKFTLLAGI